MLERLGGEGVRHRWYTSAFLRAEAVRDPEPLVLGEAPRDGDIYVDEEAWATPRPRP